MDIAVGDLIITDDEARWQVYSITADGTWRSVVALHVSLPTVLAADISRLAWSEAERAWRLRAPASP